MKISQKKGFLVRKKRKETRFFLLAVVLFLTAMPAFLLTGCQDSQNNQNSQDSPKSQDSQNSPNSQNSQNGEDSQTSQDKDNDFSAIRELTGKGADYSDAGNWLNLPEITCEADTIYLYPTCYIDDAEDAPEICDIDNEAVREQAQNIYQSQATAFEKATNVFAPYYSQSNLTAVGGLRGDDLIEFQMGQQRTDIYAALDYYFENYNEGRPFFLAGHSQGSTMVMIILGEYMQAHPDYYDRMIAAYPIGYSVTKDWLEAHPYAKFAEGEKDTGVIVSWNTEGPGNKNANSLVVEPGAVSINPINWKRDDTYAEVGENAGSLLLNEETGSYELTDGVADAKLDLERGVVICSTEALPYMSMADTFGPESLHNGDYVLYYGNLQKNVADRAAEWLQREG